MTTKNVGAGRCVLCGLAVPLYLSLDSNIGRKEQLRDRLKLFCGVQTGQPRTALCRACIRKLQQVADRCQALRTLAAKAGHSQLVTNREAPVEQKVSGEEGSPAASPDCAVTSVPESHSPVAFARSGGLRRVAVSPCGATPKRIKRTDRVSAPEAQAGPAAISIVEAPACSLPRKKLFDLVGACPGQTTHENSRALRHEHAVSDEISVTLPPTKLPLPQSPSRLRLQQLAMRAVMPRPITSTCPIEEHEEDVGSHSTSDPEVASIRIIADEAKRVANNDKSALRNKSLDAIM